MAKKQLTFPCTIYALTSNYNVRKVTLVRPFSQINTTCGYTARGVFYAERNIHPTPKAAIKAGRAMLNRRLKSITRAQKEIGKQIDALNKAEKDAS